MAKRVPRKERAARTLAVADRVRELLSKQGVPCAVIGAVALAVHGYPRATLDLDLGTATNPFPTFPRLVDELRAERLTTEFVAPDADDPLGGVVTVRGKGFSTIQVVNFLNPIGAVRTLASKPSRKRPRRSRARRSGWWTCRT